MRFRDTRPPVNDGSNDTRSASQVIAGAIKRGAVPMPLVGKLKDPRPMDRRWTATKLKDMLRLGRANK